MRGEAMLMVSTKPLQLNPNLPKLLLSLPFPPYLVVEACAMIFPPIGFFGSAENIAAAPST